MGTASRIRGPVDPGQRPFPGSQGEVVLLEWDCAAFDLSHFGGTDAQDLSCQALPLQTALLFNFP